MKLLWGKKEGGAEDDEATGTGPQNVLTVRSLTHLPRSEHTNSQLKTERAPASLGNNHWAVANWHNSIRTSQYSWWNFLFLDLFQQVIIPANAYFIAMAILQLIPAISDSKGVPTYLIPLGFVFAVTMIKDCIEDVQRHQSDQDENGRRTQILNEKGEWEECQWSKIRPGDIVKVEADEVFPADLLMITNSDDDGIAYVETVQLDGETNMKTKTAIPLLHETYSHNTDLLAKLRVEVVYGPPSSKLYQFQGVLRIYDKNHDFTKANNQLRATLSKQRSLFGAGDLRPSLSQAPSGSHIPSVSRLDVASSFDSRGGLLVETTVDHSITMAQFLWRGATLTNTNWVCGVAVYTGHHTRIMKNTRGRSLKYSGLMKSYNYNAISLFLMLISFCVLAGVLYVIDVKTQQGKSWYLAPEASQEFSGTITGSGIAFAVCFGRYLLLLSYFIPITLLVQIEIARWFHGYYISSDEQSYSTVTDTYPCVSTLSVIEDLGCVTHVFSDKTGTLTQNVMQLKSFAINGVDMEAEEDEDDLVGGPSRELSAIERSVVAVETAYLDKVCQAHFKSTGKETETPEEKAARIKSVKMSPNRFVMFDAKAVRKKLLLEADRSTQTAARAFLLVLAACHSVLPKTTSCAVTRVIEAEKLRKDSHDNLSPLSLTIPKLVTDAGVEPEPLPRPTGDGSPRRDIERRDGALKVSAPVNEPRLMTTFIHRESGTRERDRDVGIGEQTPSVESRFEPAAQHRLEMETSPWMTSPDVEEETPEIMTADSPGSIPFQRTFTPPFSAVKADEEVRRVVRQRYREAFHGAALPDTPLGPEIAAVRWNEDLDAAYDASSPDELALVAGAKHLGIEFLRRPDLNTIELAVLNENAEKLFLTRSDLEWIEKQRQQRDDTSLLPSLIFEVIEVLDFDNFRKRMSVIIKDRDNLLKILTKGADSSMMAVAAPGQQGMLKKLSDNLADYAREGLRTLVLGYRILTQSELDGFISQLTAMRMSGSDDPEKSAALYSQIECNLTLVGCTAIDDKLQDAVPQTIEALKDAGIRVWVLTGDKVETAIAIGHSCNLLTDTTYNAVINGGSLQEVQDQMYEYMAFVVGGQLAREAFDQILAQQQSVLPGATENVNAGDPTDDTCLTARDKTEMAGGGCGGCVQKMKVCCNRPRRDAEKRRKRKQGNTRKTAVMSIDDFISILTFNAKHKKVVAPVDGHSAPKHLSPEELDRLIAVYVQNFNPKDEESKGAFSMIGDLVGNKKPAVQVSPTRTHPAQDLEVIASNDKSQGDVEQYTSVAITITGDALAFALSNDETRRYFFGLAHLCSTVIACRVTPKQKAEVVRQCGRCTPTSSFCSLGIGDGANDVGMILTARIGIGLLGKEGSQAARSADIAIGEFKILRNLLFSHGHTILRRHSAMMYQTIYKNFVFAMSGYLIGFVSGFSAADCFDPFLKQLYNLLFTPWPVMSLAVFDRHLPYDILLQTAALYPIALRPDGSYYYGPRNFFGWILYAMLCAATIVAIPASVIASGDTTNPAGRNIIDWGGFGQMVFLLVVIITISASIPYTHTIFWFTPLAFLLSAGSLYICWAVLSSGSGAKLEGSFIILNTSPLYHFTMFSIYTIAVGVLIIYWKYKVMFRPTPAVIIRERIKKGVFDVVVAPRKKDGLAVVVPRAHQKEVWKGYACTPTETRFSLRRKSLSYSFIPGNDPSLLPKRAAASLTLIQEEELETARST